MRALLRMRGVSAATRYHDALKTEPLMRTLRQPGPELQARPVDDLARPDPGQEPAAGIDLADPFHAGTQTLEALVELGLDAEVVPRLLRRRHGRDLLDGEAEMRPGRAREHKRAV